MKSVFSCLSICLFLSSSSAFALDDIVFCDQYAKKSVAQYKVMEAHPSWECHEKQLEGPKWSWDYHVHLHYCQDASISRYKAKKNLADRDAFLETECD